MNDVTREQLMRQIEESHKTMQQLAKLFPGCFHADGRAIVASAHLPRVPADAPKPEPHPDLRSKGAI